MCEGHSLVMALLKIIAGKVSFMVIAYVATHTSYFDTRNNFEFFNVYTYISIRDNLVVSCTVTVIHCWAYYM